MIAPKKVMYHMYIMRYTNDRKDSDKIEFVLHDWHTNHLFEQEFGVSWLTEEREDIGTFYGSELYKL